MIPIPTQTASRIGLNVLLLLAGVVALRLGESVIVPLLIALLLAAVLGPAAMWLHATLKIRWGLSCIVVILGMVAANLLLIIVFSASISRMVQRLPSPNDEVKIIDTYKDFRAKLVKISPWPLDEVLFPNEPQKVSEIRVFQFIPEAAPAFVKTVSRYTAIWLWLLIMILFSNFLVLLEGRMLTHRAVAIFGPSEEVQAKATAVLFDMAKQVRTYLVWRTIINFGLAIVMGITYQAAGLSQAWTWAILLAILNYIPYLGPLIAGIPPFVDAFLSADPGVALIVFVIYWTVIVLEGYLVVPLVMGRSMDLNATTVMLACLFWELVWGTTGLFLAMPIMAGIKAILFNVPEWRAWADLMSSTDAEPKPALLMPTDSPNGKPGMVHAEEKAGPV